MIQLASLIRSIARRGLWALLVLWVVLSGVFFLSHGVGDLAAANLGPQARASQLEAFRQRHGLDRPLHVQYLDYLGSVAQGDLGRSLRDGRPVMEVMLTRIPRSALLGTLALFFELLFGLIIGSIAALRQHSWFDTGFMALAFLGISAPSFITGLLFLYLFSFRLGWFPIGGYGVDFWDHVYHGLLPAFTLAIIGAATYARIMRNEMIEVMRTDYVRTARAKGLPFWRVFLVHGVRTALLPVVTLVGLSLPLLVSGAIITESIFNWPGMGRLAIEALYSGDFKMVLGVVLFACLAVQVGNLIADLLVRWLDPRIAHAEKQR